MDVSEGLGDPPKSNKPLYFFLDIMAIEIDLHSSTLSPLAG